MFPAAALIVCFNGLLCTQSSITIPFRLSKYTFSHGRFFLIINFVENYCYNRDKKGFSFFIFGLLSEFLVIQVDYYEKCSYKSDREVTHSVTSWFRNDVELTLLQLCCPKYLISTTSNVRWHYFVTSTDFEWCHKLEIKYLRQNEVTINKFRTRVGKEAN